MLNQRPDSWRGDILNVCVSRSQGTFQSMIINDNWFCWELEQFFYQIHRWWISSPQESGPLSNGVWPWPCSCANHFVWRNHMTMKRDEAASLQSSNSSIYTWVGLIRKKVLLSWSKCGSLIMCNLIVFVLSCCCYRQRRCPPRSFQPPRFDIFFGMMNEGNSSKPCPTYPILPRRLQYMLHFLLCLYFTYSNMPHVFVTLTFSELQSAISLQYCHAKISSFIRQLL